MRLLSKFIDRAGVGGVSLIPDEPEDLWHAYNLVQVGDRVTTTTLRKVQSVSSTGSSRSEKVRTTLCIRIEHVDFDQSALSMRLRGKNIKENKFVQLGAFHTVEIELTRKFTLEKDEWDSIAQERLATACNPLASADVAAVIMQEGLASLCLVTAHMTIVRAKIEMNVPKKRRQETGQHSQGQQRFYKAVFEAISSNVDFDVVKCVVIASPGFVRAQFYDWMMEHVTNAGLKKMLNNKSKFILVHTTSGYVHSLKEVMKTPAVMSQLADTKALKETQVLVEFQRMLEVAPDKAFFGFNHVLRAIENVAVTKLLVSDSLFRSPDLAVRKKYVALVETAKEQMVDVYIFSGAHESGKTLDNLTGVAALLRFPMPELEDEVELYQDSEDSD